MSWGGGGSFGGGGGGGSFGGGGGGSPTGGSFNTFSGIQHNDHSGHHQNDYQYPSNVANTESSTNHQADHAQGHSTETGQQDSGQAADDSGFMPSVDIPSAMVNDWTQASHLLNIDDDALSDLAYPSGIFQKRLAKNAFRLLKLALDCQCKPIITIHEYKSFSDCPAYTALSWSWGTSRLAYCVQVDNYTVDLYVRPNCYAALHHLAQGAEKNADYYYWIDAICINQNDPIEKARQVSMMGHIYFQAERVVAYVGEADDTSRSLFRRAKQPSSAPAPAHDARDLLEFTQRPWFHRAWVVQEVLLARKIDLRAGADTLPWRLFESYYNRVAGSSQSRNSLIHLRQWYIQQSTRMLGPSRNDYIRAANMMTSLPPIGALEHSQLHDLMQRTWNFEAGLRRDKIYAMMSLFSEPFPKRLQPDYRRRKGGGFRKSDEVVFAGLNVFMLRNCDCQMWSIGWKRLERERKIADERGGLRKARGVAMRLFEPVMRR